MLISNDHNKSWRFGGWDYDFFRKRSLINCWRWRNGSFQFDADSFHESELKMSQRAAGRRNRLSSVRTEPSDRTADTDVLDLDDPDELKLWIYDSSLTCSVLLVHLRWFALSSRRTRSSLIHHFTNYLSTCSHWVSADRVSSAAAAERFIDSSILIRHEEEKKSHEIIQRSCSAWIH